MRKIRSGGIRVKVITYTVICVVLVGLASNIYQYLYFNNVILDKANEIEGLNMDTMQQQLEDRLQNIRLLGAYCASNTDISKCMSAYDDISSLRAKNDCLTAQAALNSHLSSSSVSKYIDKLVVFNFSGLVIQAVSQQDYGYTTDYGGIIDSIQYFERNAVYAAPFSRLYESVTPYKGKRFVYIIPVYGVNSRDLKGYAYMEISQAVVTDVTAPYEQLNKLFISTNAGDRITTDRAAGSGIIGELEQESITHDNTISWEGQRYRILIREIRNSGLSIVNCVNLTSLQMDNRRLIYAVFVVIVTMLVISVIVLSIITHYVTRPITQIVAKIKKVSLNDYSFDPELEKNQGEMGEIGKMLNELAVSFKLLLEETVEMSEQRRKTEIALLQSQVNPHFLYNTLDSISWMATIQKNPGITRITKSLSNLLKNLSKGFSDKITLREELSLLNDYVTIQSIRYLETFELIEQIPAEYLDFKIVKMTLQPIVENAIFHGIEPKNAFGIITLDAREEDKYLYITVRDNGVGIDKKDIPGLINGNSLNGGSGMNGIGVSNVNNRLRLVYGEDCGLSIESVKDEFTLVTIRILKEV